MCERCSENMLRTYRPFTVAAYERGKNDVHVTVKMAMVRLQKKID